MSRTRILLLPFMAAFELLLIGVCWCLAFRCPIFAGAIADWAIVNLPDPSWYWPKKGETK